MLMQSHSYKDRISCDVEQIQTRVQISTMVRKTYLLICCFRSSLICSTPSLFALGKVLRRVSESKEVMGTTAKKKLLFTCGLSGKSCSVIVL
jgi:hypothetical protein